MKIQTSQCYSNNNNSKLARRVQLLVHIKTCQMKHMCVWMGGNSLQLWMCVDMPTISQRQHINSSVRHLEKKKTQANRTCHFRVTYITGQFPALQVKTQAKSLSLNSFALCVIAAFENHQIRSTDRQVNISPWDPRERQLEGSFW